MPPDLADPSDAFGLLRRVIPRRIGKGAGPKARILVSSLEPCFTSDLLYLQSILACRSAVIGSPRRLLASAGRGSRLQGGLHFGG